MSEKSISEQIIDEFIDRVKDTKIVDTDRLIKLKTVLDSGRPNKADILEAIKEADQKNENYRS